MNYFLCYDIADNKIRRRISKYLEKAGLHRVQKSIFFGKDYRPKQMQHIANKIAEIMGEDDYYNDSILLIPMEQDGMAGVTIYGENEELKRIAKTNFSRYF